MHNKYDPDEALRISEVHATFEFQTYIFSVHNSGGVYRVSLIRHELRKDFFTNIADVCRNVRDPCTAEHPILKEAIRLSICQHRKIAHHITVVK